MQFTNLTITDFLAITQASLRLDDQRLVLLQGSNELLQSVALPLLPSATPLSFSSDLLVRPSKQPALTQTLHQL